MINLELYFRGMLADADEVDTIAASYSLVTLGNVNERQGARTTSYILPFTPINKTIFENAELINNSSDVPYSLLEHYALIEGVEVFSGFAVIESSERGYEISAHGTNSDLFAIIKDKSIRELDLSAWDHVRNDANIKASWLNTEGYIYAFADYGKYKDLLSPATDSSITIMKHDLYPAIFHKTIIEAIAAEAGYRLAGNVLTNLEFTQKVLPYAFEKPGKETDYGIKGSRLPPFSMPVGENNPALVNFDITADPFDAWDDVNYGYVSPVSQVVSIKINFTTSIGTPNILILQLFKRPPGNASNDPNPEADGGTKVWMVGLGAGSTDEYIITVDNIGLLKGETLYLSGMAAEGNQKIGFNQFEITTTQVLNSYDTLWNVADNLPDIKQGKFFLDFLMSFNLIPNTNYSEGVIQLSYFDDVNSKPPIDWSKKIDYKEKPKWSYKFNDYAQSNRLTYKVDDTHTDGRHYDFLIANKTLPPTKTVYESPFILPLDDFIFSGLEKTLAPKALILKDQYKWLGKWKSDIEYLKDDVVYMPQGSWHVATEVNTNINPVTQDPVEPKWKYASESDIWDIKKRVTVGMIKNGPGIPVTFDDGVFYVTKFITSDKLDWAYIYDARYKVFRLIIDHTKIGKILMKLNYADINQLDQTRSIYLEDFNSTFYLDEVEQFKFNEVDSTFCRFIRL